MPGVTRQGMRAHEGERVYLALKGGFAAHKTSVFRGYQVNTKMPYQGNRASIIIDAEILHIEAIMSRCLAMGADGAIFHANYWRNRLLTLRDSGLSHTQNVAVQSLLSDLVECH
jgi:hypothetical protein